MGRVAMAQNLIMAIRMGNQGEQLLMHERALRLVIVLVKGDRIVVQHHQKTTTMISTHLVKPPSCLIKRRPNIGPLGGVSTVVKRDI